MFFVIYEKFVRDDLTKIPSNSEIKDVDIFQSVWDIRSSKGASPLVLSKSQKISFFYYAYGLISLISRSFFFQFKFD